MHGYDLNCVACVENYDEEYKLPFRILSGADEKVIRLFEAPYIFVKAYNSLNKLGNSGKNDETRLSRVMTNNEIEF